MVCLSLDRKRLIPSFLHTSDISLIHSFIHSIASQPMEEGRTQFVAPVGPAAPPPLAPALPPVAAAVEVVPCRSPEFPYSQSARQIGHVCLLELSHVATHCRWKACPEITKTYKNQTLRQSKTKFNFSEMRFDRVAE